MKSSLFERILLLLIFIAAIYIIYLLSNPPKPLRPGHFIYLPHTMGSDTTASDPGSGGRGPKLYDTLLVSTDEIFPANNACECCPTMYLMSYTGSDSTPGGKGPKFLMRIELSASDSTRPGPTEPKNEEQ